MWRERKNDAMTQNKKFNLPLALCFLVSILCKVQQTQGEGAQLSSQLAGLSAQFVRSLASSRLLVQKSQNVRENLKLVTRAVKSTHLRLKLALCASSLDGKSRAREIDSHNTTRSAV